jgi:beta-mannosidase
MGRKNNLSVVALALLFAWGCQTQRPDTMVQREINSGWTFRQEGKTEWHAATVPGTVHTDLMKNKIIEDPFYRLNEHDVQWIDKVNWEYKTVFNADEHILQRDRVQLDFKGLDTYAEVYVNGTLVLQADNMFREWQPEVKEYLTEGENELRIVFRSPVTEGLKKYDSNELVIPVSDNDLAETGEVEGGKKVSVYTRKAGYHFGWDWGPRLVTSGIWRPVYLKAWNEARIESMQILQNKIDTTIAKCTAVLEIESENSMPAHVLISNDGKELAHADIQLTEGVNTYPVDFEIKNPELWWTNGLGGQPLYTIQAKLAVAGTTAEASERIGFRTLELVRDKDETGTSFYFKLNGVPVFMKGANYIPNDVFLPRVTEENYRQVVETARISNNNMLRVWGGGIYENDIFYDLCDEAGILVWQDFMFACAMFPGDDAFLENVKQEAVDNIKRLRNHPSIALWCGNNEILGAWYSWGWKRMEEAKSQENADIIWDSYKNIFHKVLPEAVTMYDPARAYWSSSPSSGTGIPADLVNGDEHYWGVWWGKEPFKNYETNIARFMSEYGFQSFPELKTVKQYAIPEDFRIDSEVMNSHQRSSIGNKTIEYYMLQDYKQPKDFESFLYVNHVLQAEGIKFALEGHRRKMPYCMGSLYWQINDCWPVASWSSTDYYQRWKALQYYVKKGFEPVLVSPYTEGDLLKIGIVNDELRKITGELNLKLIDFEGNQVWETSMQVAIPKNSSATYFELNKPDLLRNADSKSQLLTMELVENGKAISGNTFYFYPVKELSLPHPNIEYEFQEVDHGFEITLQSDKLAKNLFMAIGDDEGFFSDNYFDLLPGTKVVINLKTDIPLTRLQKIFTIRSLDDAF